MSTWTHVYIENTLLNSAGVEGPPRSLISLKQFQSKFEYVSDLFPKIKYKISKNII